MTVIAWSGRIENKLLESIFWRIFHMRNASEAAKVNKTVEEILKVFDEGKLSEEEMRDALKATEVVLGIRPPMMPFHHPMGPEGMPPRPPHIKEC
jgi:hypothetical protein